MSVCMYVLNKLEFRRKSETHDTHYNSKQNKTKHTQSTKDKDTLTQGQRKELLTHHSLLLTLAALIPAALGKQPFLFIYTHIPIVWF